MGTINQNLDYNMGNSTTKSKKEETKAAFQKWNTDGDQKSLTFTEFSAGMSSLGITEQGLYWIMFQMAQPKKNDDKLDQKEFEKVFDKIYEQSTRPNFFFRDSIQ